MANHIRKSKKAKGHGQKPKRGRPKTKKTGGKSKGGQKLSKIDLQQAKIKKNLNKHQISNNRVIVGQEKYQLLKVVLEFLDLQLYQPQLPDASKKGHKRRHKNIEDAPLLPKRRSLMDLSKSGIVHDVRQSTKSSDVSECNKSNRLTGQDIKTPKCDPARPREMPNKPKTSQTHGSKQTINSDDIRSGNKVLEKRDSITLERGPGRPKETPNNPKIIQTHPVRQTRSLTAKEKEPVTAIPKILPATLLRQLRIMLCRIDETQQRSSTKNQIPSSQKNQQVDSSTTQSDSSVLQSQTPEKSQPPAVLEGNTPKRSVCQVEVEQQSADLTFTENTSKVDRPRRSLKPIKPFEPSPVVSQKKGKKYKKLKQPFYAGDRKDTTGVNLRFAEILFERLVSDREWINSNEDVKKDLEVLKNKIRTQWEMSDDVIEYLILKVACLFVLKYDQVSEKTIKSNLDDEKILKSVTKKVVKAIRDIKNKEDSMYIWLLSDKGKPPGIKPCDWMILELSLGTFSDNIKGNKI